MVRTCTLLCLLYECMLILSYCSQLTHSWKVYWQSHLTVLIALDQCAIGHVKASVLSQLIQSNFFSRFSNPWYRHFERAHARTRNVYLHTLLLRNLVYVYLCYPWWGRSRDFAEQVPPFRPFSVFTWILDRLTLLLFFSLRNPLSFFFSLNS